MSRKLRDTDSSRIREGFFADDEYYPDEITPRTGDRSLYWMPCLGRKNDWENLPPSERKLVGDRREYIQMTSEPEPSDELSSVEESERSEQTKSTHCHCQHCLEKRSSSESSRAAGRKKRKTRKRARRVESIALESEKLGRQLAMAVSMFAAGFALGNVTSEWKKNDSDQDDQ